jgi:3-phytase
VAGVETEPVPNMGDAADDPAIWVHPVDPALSLVLGTDKKGGLNVFDLEGNRLLIDTARRARPR